MIVEGVPKKAKWMMFRIGEYSMTTGNMVMWHSLDYAAKKRIKVKLEGVMETVMFKKRFVPVRFVE